MQQWEYAQFEWGSYRQVTFSDGKTWKLGKDDGYIPSMGQLGGDGWELVAVQGSQHYFKRPKP